MHYQPGLVAGVGGTSVGAQLRQKGSESDERLYDKVVVGATKVVGNRHHARIMRHGRVVTQGLLKARLQQVKIRLSCEEA